ncbi:hypothetical protein HOK00_10295 [bacterium]|jgi:hypothetical protein|nr:hypothetical protein [bacterium]
MSKKISELQELKNYFETAKAGVEEYEKALEDEAAGKGVVKASLKRLRKVMDTCASAKVAAKKETLELEKA